MAIEDNIPNQINIPGPLTGRNASSNIAPMGFAAFATNMKSDIAPMSTLSFTTRFKSDIPNLPFANFTTAMKSDIAPMGFAAFSTNMKSDIAPIAVSQFDPNLKSFIAPKLSVLGSNNELSNTAPSISTLGANNTNSSTAPITSTLTGRFDASSITPFISQLSGRHESSGIDSSNTQLSGRHESSGIDSSVTTQTGRHESSGVDDGATTLGGRHETSGVDDGITTLSGRHESSGVDDSLTTPNGRFTDSSINDTWNQDIILPLQQADLSPYAKPGIADWLDNTFASGFTLNKEPQQTDFTSAGLEFSPYPGAPGPSLLNGRHDSSGVDTTSGVDFLGFNTDATGFTVNNSLLASQYQGISGGSYTYPDSQGLGFGILSTPIALAGRNESSNFSKEPGVNFVDIPNTNASGFTVQNSLLDSQFKGISGQNYTYPDAQGLGFGSVDSSQGVNFVDIPNLDSQGFTTFFDTGTPTQFKGATASDYTYPDSHGLGFGLIGNSLFTNTYPTPYTTPLFPDGFVQNQPIEESQFSKDSFAGGGKIGLETEFTHATFGGVQGQVPIMGNNPTGLGEFTSGGNTSGDIGIINAFDDTTSGAKGFTPLMFDLGLPKTQFNGVKGSPGSLEYTYPTDVGPAGTGRLMYDTPFSDAGNPYGGAYTSELAKQIPVNPSIQIFNPQGTTDLPRSFYDAAPDRIHFHEGNKYEQSLGEFATSLTLNGSHPKSLLGDFAMRQSSPSPLDAMGVVIPSNTGPTGEVSDKALYTRATGEYPNYNTQNLSYSGAGVLNQRQGFIRNELFEKTVDYDNNALYGHDLTFGGTGDDPKGLKSYKKPHILRDMGQKWNGFSNEGTPFDEGAFRGGFLTLGNRALKDVVRNTKHIISDPIKGLLWGLKQIGLQASNPKVETEVTPFLGLKRPTRIFNLGIGLLANMLTGPFGIKLYRHGLLNGFGSDKGLYEAAVTAHNAPDRYDTPGDYPNKGGGNRLIGLKEDLILNDTGGGIGGLLGGLLGQTGVEIKPLSDSSFFNGPKSLYGIGGTTIRRYDNSHLHKLGKDLNLSDDKNAGGGDSNLLAKYAVLSYGDLKAAAEDRSNSFNDFRLDAFNSAPTGEDKFIGGALDIEDYESANREIMFGYSKYDNTRERNDFEEDLDLNDPWNDPDLMDDDIDTPISDAVDTNFQNQRDQIKFVLQDVQTGKLVRFRSYITDITDNVTPSWTPTQYIGRPDPVYNYTNTERSMTFSLKMAAMSRKDMKGMYKKANFLYGLCYPHAGNSAGQAGIISPYVRLTIGDWCQQTPGFFTSLVTTIDNNYPWEINLENSDSDTAQLPHILSLALSFTVIGDGPHLSAIQRSDIADEGAVGRHIGGGLNATYANGTFFEDIVTKG